MARPRTDYRVELDGERCFVSDRDVPLELPRAWTPEHLVLAAVIRCSLLALDYHARRAGGRAAGSGTAHGCIDRRDDGLYAFTEVTCELDVEVDPPPEDPRELVGLAERGCFIGSSLVVKPAYRWRVNGTDVPSR